VVPPWFSQLSMMVNPQSSPWAQHGASGSSGPGHPNLWVPPPWHHVAEQGTCLSPPAPALPAVSSSHPTGPMVWRYHPHQAPSSGFPGRNLGAIELRETPQGASLEEGGAGSPTPISPLAGPHWGHTASSYRSPGCEPGRENSPRPHKGLYLPLGATATSLRCAPPWGRAVGTCSLHAPRSCWVLSLYEHLCPKVAPKHSFLL